MTDKLSTQERLHHLKLAFPSNEALAEWLNCSQSTIEKVADGEREASTDFTRKVKRHHEQIQKEHHAGLDALSYTIQTMEWLRQSVLTEEQQERHSEKLSRIDRILQQKADEVQTAYA